MSRTIPVKCHYRNIHGKKVYIQPHSRTIESKQNKNALLYKEAIKEAENYINDDETEVGQDIAFEQGLQGSSIPTSEAIYGYKPKEMDEYPIRKKAILSLEKKKVLERKDIQENTKDIELKWKLTNKGKKIFEDEYIEGLEYRKGQKNE